MCHAVVLSVPSVSLWFFFAPIWTAHIEPWRPRSLAEDTHDHNAIRIVVFAARAPRARKKSSQKSTRPRGAKDAVTFPVAIGRNNACVRADSLQVALGGRKRLPRVGECIVADDGPPCQRQPLRGFSRRLSGGQPFHVVRWPPRRLSGRLLEAASALASSVS